MPTVVSINLKTLINQPLATSVSFTLIGLLTSEGSSVIPGTTSSVPTDINGLGTVSLSAGNYNVRVLDKEFKIGVSGTGTANLIDLIGIELPPPIATFGSQTLGVLLSGVTFLTNSAITAADSILIAFGKVQAQISANLTILSAHINNLSNPHGVTKGQIGLESVDNTTDLLKPVSTATQAALNAKQNTIINSDSITQGADNLFLTTGERVKLDNTTGINTGDQDLSGLATSAALTTGLNTKQNTLGFTAENIANKNQISGYAGLDASGKINPLQLPATAIVDTFVRASQAAMLALDAQTGDVAIRTDLSKSFILQGSDPTILANWQELLTPTDLVSSVFGRNGVVTAQSNDYNTSQVTENTNLYFTFARVLGTILGGLSTASSAVITTTSSAVEAFGQLQAQITDRLIKSGDTITGNIANTATGFLQTASGTTAQRPAAPLNAMWRYNTTTLRNEFYADGGWRNMARLAGDIFTGDVGIGGVTPLDGLHVRGGNVKGIRIESTSACAVLDFFSTSGRTFSFRTNFNTTGFEFLRSTTTGGSPTTSVYHVDINGNIFIGGLNATERLQINGNIALSGNIIQNGNNYLNNTWQILYHSSAPLSVTGTSSTVVSFSIPANTLRANSLIKFSLLASTTTASTNVKTAVLQIGGVTISSQNLNTTPANFQFKIGTIANQNSLSSQVSNSVFSGSGVGTTSGAVPTYAINFANAQTVEVILAALTAAEVLTLNSLIIEVYVGN